MSGLETVTRVLVTARDVGAAQQNRAFVDACLAEQHPFEFALLAEPPGAAAFAAAPVPVRLIHDGEAAGAIAASFSEHRPHFVLTGLSSFGAGVDELALLQAKQQRIPTGAIQDYWGFLGSGPPYPDVFFVLDERARRLTIERASTPVRVEVTGSPKHAAQVTPVVRRRRAGASPRVVFFLQPRDVPQLVDNVRWFLDALDRIEEPVSAALRLHPADPDVAFYTRLVAGRRVPVAIADSAVPVEDELAGADVVVTCSSSVGLDHNYLQLRASEALGCLAYVTIGSRMRAFMREVIGSETVPGADLGMGVSVRSRAALGAWLARALRGDTERERYRRAVQINLRFARTASARIADYIQQSVLLQIRGFSG